MGGRVVGLGGRVGPMQTPAEGRAQVAISERERLLLVVCEPKKKEKEK